ILDSYQIVGSPAEYEYRVKMEYVFSVDKFGLRRSRRFREVIDLQECFLIDKELFLIMKELANKCIQVGLVPFNLETNEGFLRYLVVKDFGNAGRMLNIVTSDASNSDLLGDVAELALNGGFKTVNWLEVPPEEDHTNGKVLETW